MSESSNEKDRSYGQILKSSSILGAVQIVVYLATIIRTKIAAVVLGPSGLGVFSLFQSIVITIGMLSNLGIATSGVREIADAHGEGDGRRLAATSSALRRISLLTGLAGWGLTILLSYPLAKLTFGEPERQKEIMLLGATLLLSSIAGGHAAVVQGCRKIGDLARLQVASSIIGSAVSILLYLWLKHDGIVVSFVAGGGVQFFFSWWYGRKIASDGGKIAWTETFDLSRQLLVLGIAFMWNGITTCLVSFGTRAFIVSQMGLEANGIYQAAWGISGMFAGFILAAMGTDFYPRLTAAAGEVEVMNRLVNEQTEIGVLLAMPGLLGTLVITPWLMEIFYTAEFSAGTVMVYWFALGAFGQIVSWPLGYIQMAKGASKAFMVTQTLFNSVHFGLTMICVAIFGIKGAAIAFPILYVIYTLAMLSYNRNFVGFKWSPAVLRLVVVSAALIGAGFLASLLLEGWWRCAATVLLTAVACIVSTRGLLERLPSEHKIAKIAARLARLQPRLRRA